MNNQVEKIRSELLKLRDRYYKRGEESDALRDGKGMYWGGVISTFNEIITLVDSVSKEKEKVSEDLEEKAKSFSNYLTRNVPDEARDIMVSVIKDSFELGAQWQKDQMMKDAIDAGVQKILGIPSLVIPIPNDLNVGDNFKILIIKEESK